MGYPLVPTNDALRRQAQADRLEAEEAAREADEWERDLRAELYGGADEPDRRRFLFGRKYRMCPRGAPYCPHRPACKR